MVNCSVPVAVWPTLSWATAFSTWFARGGCRDGYGKRRGDCILLDHNLPDGTGLEFLDGLRALGRTLAFPTVMLTGTGSEAVAVDAMKAGAQDYLMKNRLQPEALHRALDAAIYKATTDRLLARQRVELEEAYRQAREANARKDQFLATLSHELRTPLTPILAVVSSPDVAQASVPELEETFRLIRRNVELEARLIDDLLDITRISHGKLELNLQPVDVHELIRHVLAVCGPNAQRQAHRPGQRIECRATFRPGRRRAAPADISGTCSTTRSSSRRQAAACGSPHGNPADGRLEVEVTDTGDGDHTRKDGQDFRRPLNRVARK